MLLRPNVTQASDFCYSGPMLLRPMSLWPEKSTKTLMSLRPIFKGGGPRREGGGTKGGAPREGPRTQKNGAPQGGAPKGGFLVVEVFKVLARTGFKCFIRALAQCCGWGFYWGFSHFSQIEKKCDVGSALGVTAPGVEPIHAMSLCRACGSRGGRVRDGVGLGG